MTRPATSEHARSAWGDVRVLAEVVLTVVVTWLLLAWLFDRVIEQADATVGNVPYVASALRAGVDWTNHLYRFGVVGGSAMQPIGGAPPLVQLCAALGVSATTTANAITVVLQVFVAFLGIKSAEALATTWCNAPRLLSRAERIVATWLCAFSPAIGWRLAIGDDHVVQGLLPYVSIVALAWCGRARILNVTTVLVAAAAATHGISGWGAQSVVYSAVFGAPIALAVFARRWTRTEWIAAAAVLGGVLIVLPRLGSVAAYAGSGDAARSVGESVAYSYGSASWLDWLGSIPWARALAHGAPITLNEQNVPIGPLIVLIAATRRARPIGVAVLASAVLAMLYATDTWPVSELSRVPVIGAFRVPERAIMPAILMIAPVAIAAYAARATEPRTWRQDALTVACAALIIVGGRQLPGIAREVVAWVACTAVIVLAAVRPRFAFPALALVAALGIAAFDERFPRDVPHQEIETLAELRDALHAREPALAVNRLVRLEVVSPPRPYDMSWAFAADLSSIDGVWWSPRRFLSLLSALKGRPVPATACVFEFDRDPVFPILQQLYNVQLAIRLQASGVDVEKLPPTNGAAWFPSQVVAADDAAIGSAIRSSTDLRATLAATAWRDDPQAAPSQCTGASVDSVTTDPEGQRATIQVSTAQPCTLVVATNYVSMFAATDETGRALPTFPIDIALTGIAVPAKAHTIVLAPHIHIPWWQYAGAVVGAVLVLLAVAGQAIARRWSARR